MTYDPQTEDLTFLAGDAVVHQAASADPWGSGVIGRSSTVQLEKAALGHPYIRYRDMLIEADVYPQLGSAEADDGVKLEVILICPRCRNQLRVRSERKAIEWIPGAPEIDPHSHEAVVRGVLSIEKFQCTWELDSSANVTGKGENLCRWRVVVDKNVARDA